MVSGCNAGLIVFWDSSFKAVNKIDLAKMTQFQPGVRSIDFHEQSQKMLVGTRGADVFEINSDGSKGEMVVQGHFEGKKQAELWGATVHPN
jgi:hypothetical protein